MNITPIESTCPRCDSTRLQYQENYGYWECLDCGHVWASEDDDPDYDEEPLDLGACCGCGCNQAQNILTLGKKALIPGTGWGCVVCGLPFDGAIAVVCDDCLVQIQEGKEVLKQAVFGNTLDKQRCDINVLTKDFKHKNIPHD